MESIDAESFSALSIFLRADWVVKSVMLGLALASLWSWAIIIDKFLRFMALNREADQFEDEIADGGSLEDVSRRAGEKPRHPLPRMLQSALREWRDARAKGVLNDTQAGLVIQRIDRVLEASMAREGSQVEEGLGTLAIIATASPFVGLFGTVWGIMHAMQTLGGAELASVFPHIAEALFATAIGLAAAIPAYIAYNKFSTDASKFQGRLESFADDLITAIARRAAGQG